MAPGEWLTRRGRGGRALIPSVYRGNILQLSSAGVSSKLPLLCLVSLWDLPFCKPGQPHRKLSSPRAPNRTWGYQPPIHIVMVGSHFSCSQPSLILASHARCLATHYFHSVARCCRDVPGALFPAGILVRPVGTAHHSLCTTQLVLTTSLGERNGIGASLTWQPCSVPHGPLCPLRPSAGQRYGRLQSPNKTF